MGLKVPRCELIRFLVLRVVFTSTMKLEKKNKKQIEVRRSKSLHMNASMFVSSLLFIALVNMRLQGCMKARITKAVLKLQSCKAER